MKLKNAPPEIRQFLTSRSKGELASQVRLFIPYNATYDLFWSAVISIIFLPFSIIAISSATIITMDKGFSWPRLAALLFGIGLGFLAFVGLWGLWSSIRIILLRRHRAFGYWVLRSGVLAREEYGIVNFIPWNNVTEVRETKIFANNLGDRGGFDGYRALALYQAGPSGPLVTYFRGSYLENVGELSAGEYVVKLFYDLAAGSEGDYRAFRTACAEFKTIISQCRES